MKAAFDFKLPVGASGDYRLVPGTQSTAEIKVGHRKIIEYLTDPLIRALDESFKEP